jgi:glycosyltransferase involved in cell wall biosynthesis
MTRVGIFAVARRRHGGTLLYTLAMIDALAGLPKSRYEFVIFAAPDNHEYDHAGVPIVRVAQNLSLLGRRLIGRNPFACVDKIVAPVYSTGLLICGRPFAFTLHDLQERYYPEYFSLATRAWRWLTNHLLTARAARVICESAFVKRDIVRFLGVPEERVAVIPAPPTSMLSGSTIDHDALAAVQHKFRLHKNHRRLVEAFELVLRRHPDCGLVLTGKERDEFERVFARVHELGLGDKVHHIGYVEHSELPALYRGAAVVAIPTLFESISIPVYEAFSVGAAVCASNVVALPEQVGDAGLLFDPNSTEDIAQKICALLDDPSLRRMLAERGMRRMASVTHEQYGERLGEVIDGLGRPPAGGTA